MPETSAPASAARAVLSGGAAVGCAVAVLVAALMLGGGRPQPAIEGLPDAGVLTGWALPLFRLLSQFAAVGAVGALLTGVLVGGGRGWPTGFGPRAVRAASSWAMAWAAASAATMVLTLADVLGVPPVQLLTSDPLGALASPIPQARALLLVSAVAALVSAYARWTTTRAGAGALLAVAVLGLLPPVVTGHAAQSADHDLATTSLAVHVVFVTLWVGGLVGLVLFVPRSSGALAVVTPRFSQLALVCFLAVGMSGLLNAATRLGGSFDAWTSAYGGLVMGKVAALLVLGTFGWWHRKRSIPAVLAQRPRAFLALAAGEVTVMAATFGLGVALSRTPPPQSAGAPAPAHGAGHSTLGVDVAPFSLIRVFTEWRLDALVLTVVGLGLVGYVVGVRRLADRGLHWPARRTAAAAAASAVTLVALCGGVASYSTALFSMQVTQFLTMSMVVPVLVTLSAPLTLVRAAIAGRPHDAAGTDDPGLPPVLRTGWARLLVNPVSGLTALVALACLVYATPLLEASLRSFVVHLGVNLAALVAGTLFFWTVLGIDPTPRPVSRYVALSLTGVLLALLVLAGLWVSAHNGVLGGGWFTELDWTWADPLVDQRRAGGVIWSFAQFAGPLILGAAYLASPARVSGRRGPRAHLRPARSVPGVAESRGLSGRRKVVHLLSEPQAGRGRPADRRRR